MKKLIVLAAVALFGTQVAKAQFSKGDVILGGNLNVSTNSSKQKDVDNSKTSSTSFGISPKVGVALNPNWVIGVFAQSSFSSSKDNKDIKSTSYSITPGVFVRNYHMIGQSKFAFFAEGNAGYKFGTSKYDGTKTNTLNGFSVNVLPGITYFVTKHFMLEGTFGGLSYNYTQNKQESTGIKTNKSSFDFDFPTEFGIGVNWIF
jgi:hypothetical protein